MTLVRGISHVAIVTADLDRLARFYVDLFDAIAVQVDDTPFGRIGIVRLGAGTSLNLFDIAGGHSTGDVTDFVPALGL